MQSVSSKIWNGGHWDHLQLLHHKLHHIYLSIYLSINEISVTVFLNFDIVFVVNEFEFLLCYRVSQNRCNPFIWYWFISETSTMAVIWNMSYKKCILWAKDIKSMFACFCFFCNYISFQDMQSFLSFLSQ